MKGKLLVLYGANNIGKTTQVELLEDYLVTKGVKVQRIKYPVYTLEPTGPVINAVLREGKQMPEDDFQRLYVQNRKDFEPQLKKWLADGEWVIAEDYVGTGIAWGMVRGIPLDFLEEINNDLYPADMAIFLDGERFTTGREGNNRNEQDDTLWKKAQENHRKLAKRYSWKIVQANQTKEQVHQAIIKVLEEKLAIDVK